MKRRQIVAISVLVAAAAAIAVLPSIVAAQQSNTIKVGLILSMTVRYEGAASELLRAPDKLNALIGLAKPETVSA